MTENEVIVVDGISDAIYESLILDRVKYAIISLSFTVNRMRIPDEKKRAMNIAKGKIAETLFKYFCNANGLKPDFDTCATPFWTVDKRDFLLNGNEWDIKNNFYYCLNNEYGGDYINFPALVPNRFPGDQWSKREDNINNDTKGVVFLFTFLKDADLVNGNRGKEFIDINFTPKQLEFITSLYNQYKGQPQTKEPFTEEWFWNKFELHGENIYTLRSHPSLIITAYANADEWGKFSKTGPNDNSNNNINYLEPKWYTKYGNGAIRFLNGTLCTKITNMTAPVSSLPSFLSLYPNLRNSIKCAHIRKKT